MKETPNFRTGTKYGIYQVVPGWRRNSFKLLYPVFWNYFRRIKHLYAFMSVRYVMPPHPALDIPARVSVTLVMKRLKRVRSK